MHKNFPDAVRDLRPAGPPKALPEVLRHLAASADAMRVILAEAQATIEDARGKAWQPEDMRAAEWIDRSTVPPVGPVWVTDGHLVWLIQSDGRGIPASAVRVKQWTRAYIPAPPKPCPAPRPALGGPRAVAEALGITPPNMPLSRGGAQQNAPNPVKGADGQSSG